MKCVCVCKWVSITTELWLHAHTHIHSSLMSAPRIRAHRQQHSNGGGGATPHRQRRSPMPSKRYDTTPVRGTTDQPSSAHMAHGSAHSQMLMNLEIWPA
jgi:hypothetical protein